MQAKPSFAPGFWPTGGSEWAAEWAVQFGRVVPKWPEA